MPAEPFFRQGQTELLKQCKDNHETGLSEPLRRVVSKTFFSMYAGIVSKSDYNVSILNLFG